MKAKNNWLYSKKAVACMSFLLLLIAAVIFWLWKQYGYRDSRYESSSFAMGSFIQQTLYGAGAEETANEAASAITELENKLETTDCAEELKFTPKDILLKRDIDFINKVKLDKEYQARTRKEV